MGTAIKLLMGTLVLLSVASGVLWWSLVSGEFWEPQIATYGKIDQACPPRPGSIVFTGSSSIRLWRTLPEDMSPLYVINRGFGGAQIAHVNRFAEKIVVPYRPRAVVLYAGDNDLARPFSKSPDVVLGDFRRFVEIIHTKLPGTWIYYVSMKPAPAMNWGLLKTTNGKIEAFVRTQQRVQFIDVSRAMLGADGRPRRDLYDRDPMHMNPAGYRLWTSIIRPVLLSRFGGTTASRGAGCPTHRESALRPAFP
jgi:lysophospholipase L1-like esterase